MRNCRIYIHGCKSAHLSVGQDTNNIGIVDDDGTGLALFFDSHDELKKFACHLMDLVNDMPGDGIPGEDDFDTDFDETPSGGE